jgi:mannose-1-phosphate guanylyltransferase
VVVNGDVITELDLTTLVARHDQAGAEGTIALTKVDDPSHFGVVPTDPDGRVQAFVEKPPIDEAPTDLINAGYYVLEPSVLDRIEAGRRVNIERETFPAMVADGSLYAWADDAYWIDVGTPERYLTATLDVLGDDHLADQVEIAHDAVIRRSAIGDGARIEGSATVVESVVLPGAVVEAGAIVRRSMVGRGASVGRGAVLDDLTVVGDGVRIDAGTRLSGARVPDTDGS